MKKYFFTLVLIGISFVSIAQTESIKIGDRYQGGIVYLVDAISKRGLICAPYDQNIKKVAWGKLSRTDARSRTDGKKNTEMIVQHAKLNNNTDRFAACLCDTLTIGGYDDWYLPSLEELEQLYISRAIIGNLKNDDYTSSSEKANDDVWNLHFQRKKGPQFYYNKTAKDYYVRCIRKF